GSFDRHPVLFIKSRSSEHWSYIFHTKLRISPETRGFASRTSNSGESLLSKAVATTLTDRGADVEVVVVVEDTGVLKADDKRVLTYERFPCNEFNLRDHLEVTIQRDKPITSIDRVSSVSSTVCRSNEVTSIFIHPVVDRAHERLQLPAMPTDRGVHCDPMFFSVEFYLL